jgi:septal ring factor EnvC (AmiA/AmiB activator)
MLKSIRQIPVIIAVVLILFSGSQPLPGGQIDEKQNELKRIEKKLELERKSLGKFQARERSILREMDGIEKRYQAAEKEIARLDGLGISLEGQIEELTAEVARVEREISQKQESLRKILISAYKIGPLGGAKFLWAADSLRELDRGFYLIRRLSGEAAKIIDQYAGLQREGRRKKQQLQEQLNQVSLTEQKVREEKLEADKEREAKARLIQEVRNREEVRQQLIAELEGAAKVLEDVIHSLSSQRGVNPEEKGHDFAREKGKLRFPASGVVVSGYGMVEDPEFHTTLFRKGIEIETEAGEAVRALEAGEVLYSGWLEGYGNVIIIDHGNGYFSLSARLQELGKGVGSQVLREEIIGRVSGPGPWGEAGFYFEIRHNGQPLDPEDWLAPGE